jgi:DNA repair protein RecN (Recombination protein N)
VRARTSIRRMEESERAHEVARMLSGAKVTESSMEHARNLLKASK